MRKNLYLSDNRGMTLIEALVSILILSMGILPSFSIILLTSRLATSVKSNLIAANLAQEGIEVTRALRDANWFTNVAFDTNLADGIYRVSWDSTSLLPESGNPVLKISSSGIYNYSSGVDTLFTRKIIITKIDPGGCNCELRIISEVSWPERGSNKVVRVESHLFDWP